MTDLNQQKPGEKAGRRKQKRSKKAEKPQPAQAASAPIAAAMTPAEPQVAVETVVEAALAEPVTPPEPVAPAEPVVPAEPVALAKPVERPASFKERMASFMPPADTTPAEPVSALAAPSETRPPASPPAASPAASIEAIANIYRDYARRSLEDAQVFAQKLAAARSLDKAVEAQTEFARRSCENFVENARKIRELHRELFWQAAWPPGQTAR